MWGLWKTAAARVLWMLWMALWMVRVRAPSHVSSVCYSPHSTPGTCTPDVVRGLADRGSGKTHSSTVSEVCGLSYLKISSREGGVSRHHLRPRQQLWVAHRPNHRHRGASPTPGYTGGAVDKRAGVGGRPGATEDHVGLPMLPKCPARVDDVPLERRSLRFMNREGPCVDQGELLATDLDQTLRVEIDVEVRPWDRVESTRAVPDRDGETPERGDGEELVLDEARARAHGEPR